MPNYYRVMMGAGSKHIQECLAGNFIGIDYKIPQDLTRNLTEDWREFNQKFIPIFLQNVPGKTKVAAGLAMGAVHTVCKGIQEGDIVLSPDGASHYHVAEVVGPYFYQSGAFLPHRRPVRWLSIVDKEDFSLELQNTLRAANVVVNLKSYESEIRNILAGDSGAQVIVRGELVDDPYEFVMEKHLEDFLVENWARTELGRDFQIYEDEGEKIGKQYITDTGPIDILAISKDKQLLLVVELKKGRADDVVAGQILRYMGYVRDELAEPGQKVLGLIIASGENLKLKRALSVVSEINFMRYSVTFKLQRS